MKKNYGIVIKDMNQIKSGDKFAWEWEGKALYGVINHIVNHQDANITFDDGNTHNEFRIINGHSPVYLLSVQGYITPLSKVMGKAYDNIIKGE